MTACTSAGVSAVTAGAGAPAGAVVGAVAGALTTAVAGAVAGAVASPGVRSGTGATTAGGRGGGAERATACVKMMYIPSVWKPTMRLASALRPAMMMLITPIAVSTPGRLRTPGVEYAID
jgi:hypothetical protein